MATGAQRKHVTDDARCKTNSDSKVVIDAKWNIIMDDRKLDRLRLRTDCKRKAESNPGK